MSAFLPIKIHNHSNKEDANIFQPKISGLLRRIFYSFVKLPAKQDNPSCTCHICYRTRTDLLVLKHKTHVSSRVLCKSSNKYKTRSIFPYKVFYKTILVLLAVLLHLCLAYQPDYTPQPRICPHIWLLSLCLSSALDQLFHKAYSAELSCHYDWRLHHHLSGF